MIEESPTISRSRPSDISMDYERLREEGIVHLETLATEIWTDFNAHDPGITILEVLCYALTDLGYRTNLPIEDLLAPAPGESRKSFFTPTEILPVRPYTPMDYRKLIIDVAGVKNAWVYKYYPPKGDDAVEEGCPQRLYAGQEERFKPISEDQALALIQKYYQLPVEEKKRKNSREKSGNPPLTPEELKKLGQFLKALPERPELIHDIATLLDAPKAPGRQFISDLRCQYSYFPLSLQKTEEIPDQLAPNGFYDILLSLEEGIPSEGKQAEIIKERVMDRLQANRNLDEDFAKITVLKECPICLCLDLEIDSLAPEKEVLAQVIFNIRQFLNPAPAFHTFKSLRELGWSCEHIFNGPLLNNGFLLDKDLTQAERRTKIYKSDILRVIMDTEGVLRVNELYLKKASDPGFKDAWCLDISKCGVFETSDPCQDVFKPYLDVCCSQMRLSKGVLQISLSDEDIAEELEMLELVAANPLLALEGPQPPGGKYREDLTDYWSIQYEFPHNYGIGEEGLPPNADALRRAQSRQLQAYLLFYDQILAAYLQQLGKVRDLLAVEQDPAESTYFYSALYEVPGMAELLRDFVTIKISQAGLEKLKNDGKVPDNILQKLKNLPAEVPKEYLSYQVWSEAMTKLLGHKWDRYEGVLTQAFRIKSKAEDWENYQASTPSYYLDQLQQIFETGSAREIRRNRIMDHLLARFNDRFTDYVTDLFQTKVDRETDPATQTYSEYLQAKSKYLLNLATLGSERGKAYNYRLKDPKTGQYNVWNSTNVSGLKKKISLLLGLDTYEEQSLFCDPAYTIRIQKGETKEGFSTYQLQLVEKNLEGTVLLASKIYKQQKNRILAAQEALLQEIEKAELYEIQEDGGKYKVIYSLEFEDDKGKAQKIILTGPEMSQKQAELLLSHILELVDLSNCDREGFHLLEHLLLWPNDQEDQLLCIPLAPCDAEGLSPAERLRDPYSFWITVVLPAWPQRFRDLNFRAYVEQLFHREAPAHLALRFCWVEMDEMQVFERIFQKWRIEKARCIPNECNVTQYANDLVNWLNTHICSCACDLSVSDLPYCLESTGRLGEVANPGNAVRTNKS